MGRRDPAFLTSFLYFFSFFSHFLDAETICLEVIFMLMSSSWRETRWPMVVVLSSYAASRRLAWGRVLGGALCGTLCSQRLAFLRGLVGLPRTQRSRLYSPGPVVVVSRAIEEYF